MNKNKSIGSAFVFSRRRVHVGVHVRALARMRVCARTYVRVCLRVRAVRARMRLVGASLAVNKLPLPNKANQNGDFHHSFTMTIC
jgi:hypothetical protein